MELKNNKSISLLFDNDEVMDFDKDKAQCNINEADANIPKINNIDTCIRL